MLKVYLECGVQSRCKTFWGQESEWKPARVSFCPFVIATLNIWPVLLPKPGLCVVMMQETAKREGRVFVAPYDDPFTIAGQGTIGTEILRQLTTLQLETLHAIVVPVGGGGLIAGIAAYVKALQPDVKIIGVEPSGTPGSLPLLIIIAIVTTNS